MADLEQLLDSVANSSNPTTLPDNWRHKGGFHKRFVANRRINTHKRKFVAWDGEGITYPGETQQEYVLFGNSDGFSVSAERLSTIECLELLIESERYNTDVFHIAFAFSYDAEMILRDVPVEFIKKLYDDGSVRWNGYYIEYRRKKWFSVSKKIDGTNYTARVWDLFTFFGTSFVNALREYLGNDERLNFIQSGKEMRGTFEYQDIDSLIRPYWESELALMVELANSLRQRLYDAKVFDDGTTGLEIVSWHGPGAIASYSMRKTHVRRHMQQTIMEGHAIAEPAHKAVRHAYAGGRFEHFRLGMANQTVYGYDIRSAYPSVIQSLPGLEHAYWKHLTTVEFIPDDGYVPHMAVYKIMLRESIRDNSPKPLFYRDKRLAMHYPSMLEGWYWTPEARVVMERYPNAIIKEAYVIEYDDEPSKPFEWVNDIYELRSEWKDAGNPSQLALKLLLNSMYGKFAQRVGGVKDHLPTYHQLEWAGYITSAVRAKLFDAMQQSGDSLIAVETDGIFTTKPLTLDIGPKLGQWEYSEYDNIFYLQNGFYWKQQNGEWSAKTRGFDKNSVTIDDAIKAIEGRSDGKLGSIVGTTTRFTTMGQYARTGNSAIRRRWTTSERVLSLGSGGKRSHDPERCTACDRGLSPVEDMHELVITKPFGGMSYPHPLPWLEESKAKSEWVDMARSEGVEPGGA